MFLVDVGQNSSALRHNMLVLGVQFSALDAIILTHCHYDQGTSDVLKWVGKQGVPSEANGVGHARINAHRLLPEDHSIVCTKSHF